MQRFAVLFLLFTDTLQEFFPAQVVTGQPFVLFNFHFHFNLYQAKCILLFVRCFKEGKSTFPNPPKPIYFDFFFSGSIVVYWFVNMWTRVRCLTSNLILVVVVQVSQKFVRGISTSRGTTIIHPSTYNTHWKWFFSGKEYELASDSDSCVDEMGWVGVDAVDDYESDKLFQ